MNRGGVGNGEGAEGKERALLAKGMALLKPGGMRECSLLWPEPRGAEATGGTSDLMHRA